MQAIGCSLTLGNVISVMQIKYITKYIADIAMPTVYSKELTKILSTTAII